MLNSIRLRKLKGAGRLCEVLAPWSDELVEHTYDAYRVVSTDANWNPDLRRFR